jgi:crossover junction endodeoxyribonuclease RuvC
MPTKHMKILAIDPGTREMGVAVLDGQTLDYYGVKTIRRRRSPAEALCRIQEITASLIARHRPNVLAIEKMFVIQKSASLLVVAAEEVKATARQHGLPIYEYAPTTVRKLICNSGRATKQETAKVMARRFPELRAYLEQKTKWETLYYANMFDAVALAVCCYPQVADRMGETILQSVSRMMYPALNLRTAYEAPATITSDPGTGKGRGSDGSSAGGL